MEEKEIWKDVVGYEGLYEVSNMGNVRSLDRYVVSKNGRVRHYEGKLLKKLERGGGYFYVVIKMKKYSIHQLVCIAFLGHKPNGKIGLVVNHKNFNPSDNRLDNLELVTMRENSNLKHKPSSSKYVGVTWSKEKKKWRSIIRFGKKSYQLGYYENEDDAGNAYLKVLDVINEYGDEEGKKEAIKVRESNSKATSKFKGVSWCSKRKKWVAQKFKDGRHYHIGRFKDEFEAHLAYTEFTKTITP